MQSREALGSSEEEWGRLLIDHLLRSMNPKLRGHVAHMVSGKAIQDRLDYWQLIKFAVEKEAEINFNDAKKISKPNATTHFKFDRKKTSLLVNPTVRMVRKQALRTSSPSRLRTVTVVNHMKPHQTTHLSLLETSRWLSESLMPQRHSQEGASAVIRSGIISKMRNVRCMTQIF